MEISKEDKIRLYDYLCEYESSIRSNFGCYNIEECCLKRFLADSGIFIGAYNKKDRTKGAQHKYYLLFEQKKPKGKDNDIAHHLLRHVRNSIAHNHIMKKSRTKLYLEDRGKLNNVTKVTFEGNIDSKVFFLLLEKLKQTKVD